MLSIVPVLDDLVSNSLAYPSFNRGLSLMEDLKSSLGGTNEVKTIEDNNKQLVLAVNCESFKPDEINVSIKDQYIEIKGKHEEKSDHSFVHREFSRKFKLPLNAVQEKMNCSLNSSGVLKVVIPKKPLESVDGPVNIPITFKK